MLRLCLHPVILFYVLFNGKARKASKLYIEMLNNFNKNGSRELVKPGWRSTYKHFFSFGEMMTNKFFAWQGKVRDGDIEIQTPDEFKKLMDSLDAGKGAILIGSHVGNLETMRAFATMKAGLKVSGLTYTEHSAKFNKVLGEINPSSGMNLIQIKDVDISTSMRLKEKVDSGEIVVIVADRVMRKSKTLEADFLGGKARFPVGPFILALLLECPAYFVFCVRGERKNNFYLQRISIPLDSPKSQRDAVLKAMVGEYASALEKICARYPLQWFNFFDFWRQ